MQSDAVAEKSLPFGHCGCKNFSVMTCNSHGSGRAFKLRMRSGGAVIFTSASFPARRLNASFTNRPKVDGIRPLKPTPCLLIVS